MSAVCPQDVRDFLDNWQADPLKAKEAFVVYKDFLVGLSGVSLDFKARPGISYSLRARHEAQRKRELFVLVDVVDDEPESRWLSVCFYADMITDPDEKGDYVPEGLMGEDDKGAVSALVQVAGTSVNYQLLVEGLAWVNRSTCKAMFCRRWYIQEHQAVVDRRGLWGLNMSTPPWQWSR